MQWKIKIELLQYTFFRLELVNAIVSQGWKEQISSVHFPVHFLEPKRGTRGAGGRSGKHHLNDKPHTVEEKTFVKSWIPK